MIGEEETDVGFPEARLWRARGKALDLDVHCHPRFTQLMFIEFQDCCALLGLADRCATMLRNKMVSPSAQVRFR